MNAQLSNRTAGECPPMSVQSDEALACRLKRVIDGGPEAIAERLAELDREWTVGKAAATAAGGLLLGSVLLGRGFRLPLAVAAGGAMLQHGVGRHSFISRLLAQYGLRTEGEVERERTALKALRGDFHNVPTVHAVVNDDDLSRLEGEGGIVVEPESHAVNATQAVSDLVAATQR
ncbi:MAG: hypothetical protein U0871_18605 [Gemmataceae bacterium]